MTFRGGDFFTAEIFNRLAARLTPAQIVGYLNESLAIIAAAASFKWDQNPVQNIQTDVNAAFVGGVGNLDSGKKISALNHTTKTPIYLVPQEEYGISAAGYVDQTGNEYNAFSIQYSPTGAYVQFYPVTLPGLFIDIVYHQLPPVLTVLPAPTVRWDVPFMDSVLMDMTEAACKRILSIQGWQDREASARAKLIEAVKIYSTDRINTGTAQEVGNAKQEQQQIGRS